MNNPFVNICLQYFIIIFIRVIIIKSFIFISIFIIIVSSSSIRVGWYDIGDDMNILFIIFLGFNWLYLRVLFFL